VASAYRSSLLAGAAYAAALLAPDLASAQLAGDGSSPQFSGGGQAPTITTAGRTTDITLRATRTILGWSVFNVGASDTVIYRLPDRGAIVLNRITTGQAVIDGRIESLVGNQLNAGNVWFSAPGGVVFGPNARVDVGGLLATSANVSPADFLDASTFGIGFTDGGSGRVEVRSGAEIRAGSGALALVAGSVSTEAGAFITGGGNSTALFGAADDFTVRFTPQTGDLDLVDFVVPSGGGTGSSAPLTLLGQTAAGNVILAVVNRADVASAVINATGLIAANTAAVDNGDVVLVAGADVINRQPSSTRTNTTTETTANFGIVTARRDMLAGFAQPANIVANQLAGGRDVAVATGGLDVGVLAAGRLMAVDASRQITANGLGVINAGGRLQADVGSIHAGQLNSGASVVVNASGVGAGGAAAVRLTTVLAADDITIASTNAAGHIQLTQALITGVGPDTAPAGRRLTLTASGSGADVSFGGANGTAVQGATLVSFSAGRDVTANIAGAATIQGSAGRDYLIRAVDLEIAGPLSAGNLRVEAASGSLTLGGPGTSTATAMRISDAEFQRITVTGTASFIAGAANGSARGNLVVDTLNVDPARVPRLFLGAGPSNDVLVNGVVAPTADGGTLTIGDAAPDGAFRPQRILVSGAIGAASGTPESGFSNVRAFDAVTLNARSDIILGSQRFISLVQSVPLEQVDVSQNMPSGVAPTPEEQGRVYLVADSASFSANTRIIQQNTGTATAQNGLIVQGDGSTATTNDGLTVSDADLVELFGVFRNSAGVVQMGLSASTGNLVLLQTGTVRFNGCALIGGTCAAATMMQSSMQAQTAQIAEYASGDSEEGPESEAEDDEESEEEGAGEGSGRFVDVPLLRPAPPEGQDTDPVPTGTGSEELWRTQRQR
jgi:filamentous hemagglutinin family protein